MAVTPSAKRSSSNRAIRSKSCATRTDTSIRGSNSYRSSNLCTSLDGNLVAKLFGQRQYCKRVAAGEDVDRPPIEICRIEERPVKPPATITEFRGEPCEPDQ